MALDTVIRDLFLVARARHVAPMAKEISGMARNIRGVELVDRSMSSPHLVPLLREAERRAIIAVLRGHPCWTLGDLLDHIERAGPRAATLRDLRLEELVSGEPARLTRPRLGAQINPRRLAAAKAATGAQFDEHVREVLEELRQLAKSRGGKGWVGAGFLRDRVGGPRWKLQASLGRLVAADLVERMGKTSSTRYRRSDREVER